MPESHKCQICGKPATVHLTQIVGNKIQKIDLCEDCAREKGIIDPDGIALDNIASELPFGLKTPKASESVSCPDCGFSAKDFKKLGHFGCPSCYDSFGPIITPMLQGMHKDAEHKGKVPERSLARLSLRKKITLLERQLQEAVSEERFEDAAHLRDELAGMKDTLKEKLS